MGLRDFYIFRDLAEDELRELEEISHYKEYKKDDVLFQIGDKSKYLCFLSKGIVNLSNESHSITIYSPSFIEEFSNYDERNYSYTCTFECDAQVTLIDYAQFKKKFLNKEGISLHFLKSLSSKIKSLEEFINTNVALDVNAKIAKFLYENEKLLYSIKQIKIAQILNIREETLSRKIAWLIKEGIIRKEKRNIIIQDHQKLLSLFL